MATGSRNRAAVCAVVAACGSIASAQFGGDGSTLPAVEFPAENPFSEAKRVLGKVLFDHSKARRKKQAAKVARLTDESDPADT